MVLLNRPLTPDEMRRVIADLHAPYLAPLDMRWFFEPADDVLHYFADRNEIVRAQPEVFYRRLEESPSNCTWMMGANGPAQRRRF